MTRSASGGGGAWSFSRLTQTGGGPPSAVASRSDAGRRPCLGTAGTATTPLPGDPRRRMASRPGGAGAAPAVRHRPSDGRGSAGGSRRSRTPRGPRSPRSTSRSWSPSRPRPLSAANPIRSRRPLRDGPRPTRGRLRRARAPPPDLTARPAWPVSAWCGADIGDLLPLVVWRPHMRGIRWAECDQRPGDAMTRSSPGSGSRTHHRPRPGAREAVLSEPRTSVLPGRSQSTEVARPSRGGRGAARCRRHPPAGSPAGIRSPGGARRVRRMARPPGVLEPAEARNGPDRRVVAGADHASSSQSA